MRMKKAIGLGVLIFGSITMHSIFTVNMFGILSPIMSLVSGIMIGIGCMLYTSESENE